MLNNTVYEWILPQFSAEARAAGLQDVLSGPLSEFVRPGDQVLDLCCGTGPMSFWFAKRGTIVTGMDFASYMLAQARQEARRRNSSVEFIEADILQQDLGEARFDLVACFGNSISDFPLADFARLGRKVARAMKPGGRFALQYHDGSYRYMQGNTEREGVYQETPDRITFRFREYQPELGAVVNTIRNETRGQEYQRASYIYTVPVVRVTLTGVLDLERHIRLEENHYLDIFTHARAVPSG